MGDRCVPRATPTGPEINAQGGLVAVLIGMHVP